MKTDQAIAQAMVEIPCDEANSKERCDQHGLTGGANSPCTSTMWYIAIGAILAAAGVVVLVVCLKKRSSKSPSGLASKVVMVTWGDETYEGDHWVGGGTGLIATFNNKIGVLTNYHVIPERTTAETNGRIHVNYTGKQLGRQRMLKDGIHMKPYISEGGFFYTGGVCGSKGVPGETDGQDWSFVGLDWEALQRQHPDIKPYDLRDTTTTDCYHCGDGEKVTIWHHGGLKPRRVVHTTIWHDQGMEGTLAPQPGNVNKLEPGSSGSPIFRSANNKLMGVFWGADEQWGVEVQNRFVVIDAVLSQLDAQMRKDNVVA